jgi:transposase
MAKELVPEQLWKQVQPLLPLHREHPKGGNDFKDDRACLRGIIFVLKSGISWQLLPTEVFGVSGSTCWRRFRDWTRAGIWPQLHRQILAQLGRLKQVDLSAAVIDSASVRAVFGGATPGPTPPTGAKKAANAT